MANPTIPPKNKYLGGSNSKFIRLLIFLAKLIAANILIYVFLNLTLFNYLDFVTQKEYDKCASSCERDELFPSVVYSSKPECDKICNFGGPIDSGIEFRQSIFAIINGLLLIIYGIYLSLKKNDAFGNWIIAIGVILYLLGRWFFSILMDY